MTHQPHGGGEHNCRTLEVSIGVVFRDFHDGKLEVNSCLSTRKLVTLQALILLLHNVYKKDVLEPSIFRIISLQSLETGLTSNIPTTIIQSSYLTVPIFKLTIPATKMPALIVEEPPIVLAQLESINFARLLQNDPTESEKLLRACQTHGFFYLNLLTKSADGILDDYSSVLRVMSEWFDQPLAKKMEFDNGSTATHGYKPSGTQSGVLASTKDGFEALRVRYPTPHIYIETNM